VFETKLFLSVDEREAFMKQFELLRIDIDSNLLVGQTDMDLLSSVV
jgi:hypothetical protein